MHGWNDDQKYRNEYQSLTGKSSFDNPSDYYTFKQGREIQKMVGEEMLKSSSEMIWSFWELSWKGKIAMVFIIIFIVFLTVIFEDLAFLVLIGLGSAAFILVYIFHLRKGRFRRLMKVLVWPLALVLIFMGLVLIFAIEEKQNFFFVIQELIITAPDYFLN